MNQLLIAWLILTASIVFESIGMIFLRHSNGFANFLPTAGGICCFLLSIWTFTIALKHIEMGIAYAVWAAASTAIVALLGIALYQEPISALKIAGVTMIVSGVVMLNLTTK